MLRGWNCERHNLSSESAAAVVAEAARFLSSLQEGDHHDGSGDRSGAGFKSSHPDGSRTGALVIGKRIDGKGDGLADLDIPDIPEPADHELETQVSWGL